MSKLDWRAIPGIVAATLQDVAVSAGQAISEALFNLQGQANAVKARTDITERNSQGSALVDLTGLVAPYDVSEEDSQKPLIVFFQDVSTPGQIVNIFNSASNPSVYTFFNCSDYPLQVNMGTGYVNLVAGKWTAVGYTSVGNPATIDYATNLPDGDYGDISILSSVWTIDNGAVTYAKLATALQTLIDGKEATANKGVANGYAPLDATGKVAATYLPANLQGNDRFKGVWNANTNVVTSDDVALNGLALPAAATGNLGYYFRVSVAGSTAIDGENDWKVKDIIQSIGTSWIKLDNTDSVLSVNGASGTVVLNTDNISESGSPTNLWFTVARAVAAITTTTMGALISGATGKTTPVDADSLLMSDSAAAGVGKKVTWANVKATLAAYFTTLYLALPAANGIAVRTSASTSINRTLTGTANQVDIANGDGTGGNPTFSTPSTFIAPGSIKATTTLDVGAAGSNFPGWIAQFTANANTYSQISHQNKSNGASASGDFIITADNGTDTTNYADFGINGSGYASAGWTISGALDAYLYSASSHLTVGTASAKDLIFHTGGLLAANIRFRIMSDGEWRLNNGASGNSDEVLTCKGANQPPVWQHPNLATYNFITTTDYSVTSTSYAVVNAAVRLTGLPAGKYLVLCVGQLAVDDVNVDGWLGIHAGTSGSTTLATGGETPVRPTQQAGLGSTYRYEIPVTVFAYPTITAGQVIEPKIKSSSGGIDILNCSITAIRIG
jgi:hypothetical protein